MGRAFGFVPAPAPTRNRNRNRTGRAVDGFALSGLERILRLPHTQGSEPWAISLHPFGVEVFGTLICAYPR
jgi:hypothetical protein